VFNYTQQDIAAEVRRVAPDGVDLIAEVAVAANAEQDAAMLGRHGVVSIYGGAPDEEFTLPVRPMMALNARWQFVLLYTVPVAALAAGVQDLRAAIAAGAIRVGDEVGLPLHRFPLSDTAAAHQAVEDGAVGKVLIEVDRDLD
jgi:NADPH2:quinone reductase